MVKYGILQSQWPQSLHAHSPDELIVIYPHVFTEMVAKAKPVANKIGLGTASACRG